jgi:hypothetical protein
MKRTQMRLSGSSSYMECKHVLGITNNTFLLWDVQGNTKEGRMKGWCRKAAGSKVASFSEEFLKGALTIYARE